MENPCKIICFGDSITRNYAPMFETEVERGLPDIDSTVINAGVDGETSRNGLQRLDGLLEERPQVVIIGFGMNDQSKGVTTVEMANNLCHMTSAFEEIGARVLLLTMNPVLGVAGDCGNARIDAYNQVIKDAWSGPSLTAIHRTSTVAAAVCPDEAEGRAIGQEGHVGLHEPLVSVQGRIARHIRLIRYLAVQVPPAAPIGGAQEQDIGPVGQLTFHHPIAVVDTPY